MLRRVLFQLHLWCGVGLGLFLVVQAITGVAVAFRHAGNKWVHHDEMIVVPDERLQIPMSAVLDSFGRSFPGIPLNVLSVMFPQAPDEAFFIRVWDNAPSPNFYVSMNPYTGDITGSGSKYQYPFELAFRIHEQLSMGTPGIKAVHAGGFLMMLMSASGLILWWPRGATLRQALRIHRRPTTRFLHDLHRVIGAYAFTALFIVATSGTMILGLLSLLPFKSAPSGLNAFAGATLDPNPSGPSAPIDDVIAAATAHFPSSPIRDLSYIRLMRRVAVVSFIADDNPNIRALNRVFFERHSGRVLAVVRASDLAGVPLIEQWALPVHSGEIIGNPGRLLVMLSGLAVPFLFVTGLWSWLKMRSVARKKHD